MQAVEKIINVSIDLIIPNRYQPRKQFDELSLNELAKSIKEYGILNPILVTKTNDGYEIIAGERRYRAAKKIGLTEVPVIIKELSETGMAEIALIENLQRENLTPIEEARSYQEIMKIGNLTQQSLGDKIGKSQSAIANKIRLLTLPESIQEALNSKKISERHARSLMQVKDIDEQNKLLNKIIKNKMTVKELDTLINQQSITEKEIKDAINDIMKSLNMTNEEIKKEEKESDNMNNGNFFPNFNNTMGPNNNVSLNSMNMQSMNNTQMPQVEETVMPTNPMPTPVMEPMMNQPIEMAPVTNPQPEQPIQPMNNNFMQDASLFNGQPTMDFQAMNPMMNQSIQSPMLEPIDPPLFGGNLGTNPMPTPVMEPMMNQPIEMAPVTNPQPENNLFINPVEVAQPMPETVIQPVIEQPAPTPTYEIPVTTEIPTPVVETPVDKLTEVKKLLEDNGINYKSYSNETNHCIIIEL